MDTHPKDEFLVVELCPGANPEDLASGLLAHVVLHGDDRPLGRRRVAVGHDASDGEVGHTGEQVFLLPPFHKST